jgi:hypothetical protein
MPHRLPRNLPQVLRQALHRRSAEKGLGNKRKGEQRDAPSTGGSARLGKKFVGNSGRLFFRRRVVFFPVRSIPSPVQRDLGENQFGG